MKKVISFLSAVAMAFSLVTSIAFADENNKIFWEKDNETQTSVTYSLYMLTEQDVISGGVNLDASDMIAKGVTVDNLKIEKKLTASGNFSYNKSKNYIVATLAATPSAPYEAGKICYGTITFDLTNATGSFTLPIAKSVAIKGTDKSTLDDKFTLDGAVLTVTKPTPTPSEKAAVAGKAIEDGFKTFSTDAAIEFAVDATPTIEISKSGTTDKLTETLGSGVIGEGKTKIIPIVSYKIGRHGVAAGDIFTIKVTNGTDTSSWTYTVPAE